MGDEIYTKKGLLSLLEVSYDDEGCATLLRAIEALPTSNQSVLISLIDQVSEAHSRLGNEHWLPAVLLFDAEITKCLAQIMLDKILKAVRQFGSHMRHWKKSIQSPVTHFIQNGKWEWFRNRPAGLGLGISSWTSYLSHKQRTECNDKIETLAKCEESFAMQAGQLYTWINQMESVVTYRSDVSIFGQVASSLYYFISGKSDRSDIRPPQDPKELLHLLRDIIQTLPDFDVWFSSELAEYSKPPHLKRHWLSYTLGAVGGLYLANRIYTNRADIATWMSQTSASLGGFWTTHITEPCTALYNNIFQTFRDRENLQASKAGLQASRRSLSNMLHDFAVASAKENAQREGKPIEQYRAEIKDRALAADMSLVMPQYEQDIRKPVRSLASGELVQGLLIQVQKVKVDSEAAMLAMDQVLKANEINFAVLAIIPAVVMFGAVTVAIKRFIFKKPSLDVVFRKIRRSLRQTESLLIQCHGKQMDLKQIGFLLLYLEKMERLVKELPPRLRIEFEEDIKHLRSVDLTIDQKQLVIVRMYRNVAPTPSRF